MARNRPISILDDKPDPWSRIRETVSAEKEAKRPARGLAEVGWFLLALIFLSAGVAGGYYLLQRFDVRGFLESAGIVSSAPAKTTELKDVPKLKKPRGSVQGRAVRDSETAQTGELVYNVEVVDNKTREDNFSAVAVDSSGRVQHMKPTPMPALVIPHALPTSTPKFGLAIPALPSTATTSLALDQYRDLNGSVTLQAAIGTDGALKEYAVLQGPVELVQPALKVAMDQRYEPPRKKNTARWTTITVNFKPPK